MTRDEALSVVAALMASWPSAYSWSDETVELWLRDLADRDPRIALAAVDRCRRTLDYPPVWRQYAEAYDREWDRARPKTWSTTLELPPVPRTPPAQVQRRIAAMRAAVHRHDGADHDHHNGAEHCPICGKHEIDANGVHDSKHCLRCKQLAEKAHAAGVATPQP